MSIACIPPEMLVQVFCFLSGQDLVTCLKVCRQWREILSLSLVWRKKCLLMGYWRCGTALPKRWAWYYLVCERERNLIKNPRAESQCEHWLKIKKTTSPSGFYLDIYTQSIRSFPAFSVAGVTRCFILYADWFSRTDASEVITSDNSRNGMRQTVDLYAEGYDERFMDLVQPQICVSSWYSPRVDVRCCYMYTVTLLSDSMRPLSCYTRIINFRTLLVCCWQEMSHVFFEYGAGVRYVQVNHEMTCYPNISAGVAISESVLKIKYPRSDKNVELFFTSESPEPSTASVGEDGNTY
ncbi:putative F-box-containing protein [Namao virus]|nr:putative F-box-containing protein [Namao virus]